MAKRVLITGGTGFLGAALSHAMVKAGHKVRILDNQFRGNTRRIASILSQVELVEGDIRDPKTVMAACENIELVCHLAFINGTEYFYKEPQLVLDVGVRGMLNILDASIAHKVPEFFLMSSSEVYQTPPKVPTDESVPLSIPDPLNPRYSYGGGKLISELMAINYGRHNFKRLLIVRPHNVYGPDMGYEHVIPQLSVKMAKAAEPTITIQGTGQETRAFVYVDDFTDGVLKVIDHGEHMNIYHVGTNEEVKILTITEEIAHALGREFSIQKSVAPLGATPRRCPDISKVIKLGYKPKVSLREGVTKTALWYKANPKA